MVKDLFWPLKVVLLAAVAMVSPFNWATTVALDIIAYFVDRPEAQAVARELLCPVMLMCAAKMLKCAYLQPWLAERGLTTAASRVSTSTFWGASALAGRALWELYWIKHGPHHLISTANAQQYPHALFAVSGTVVVGARGP
jgi:hypothetical protein